MKTLKDFNFTGKRALVRCDFNVPIDNNGNILDNFRIEKTLPTIKYLIENNAKIILMSHLAEPNGKVNDTLKLDKVKETLEKFLNINIIKSPDCIGSKAKELSENLKDGEILLLENLRFHKEETDGDLEFAKELSELGDVYINDAFSVCHRNHASISGIPKYLPSAAGFLLEKEINALDIVLGKSPSTGSGQAKKPMTAIVGGKKVETKSKFINNISKVADFVIISGLIKKEVIENKIEFDFPEKIVAPLDSLDALDIDEDSIKLFKEKILQSKTVLWNGPFGKFEEEKYAKGTLAIAKAIIECKAFSVVGGGETIEFISRHGLLNNFSHVSTGGGAMMAYLAGEEMPGLVALDN